MVWPCAGPERQRLQHQHIERSLQHVALDGRTPPLRHAQEDNLVESLCQRSLSGSQPVLLQPDAVPAYSDGQRRPFMPSRFVFVLSLCAAPLFAQQIPPQPPTNPPAQQVPAPPPAQPTCGGRSSNPRTACQPDIDKMMAALPDQAPAKPARPRKVLVLNHAAGFVHSSIPLAGLTVEAMGKKTGAYTATITWDAADINADNLKQYSAIFLEQHHRLLPRRSEGRRSDGGTQGGAARIRARRKRHRRHPCRERLVPWHGLREPMASAGEALWPECNKMIGGYFKFHWNNPQLITVKIDDPKSPLTAMFNGQDFEIHDETYVQRTTPSHAPTSMSSPASTTTR